MTADDHVFHCPGATTVATIDFQSPPLLVTAGEPFKVKFRHRHSFEHGAIDDSGEVFNFDGGVIEISTDAGATWMDVGASVAGYNGRIASDFGNALAGREAFVAESFDFITTGLDFGTAYGGRSVMLRFRVASDDGTAYLGWDIDDITVTGVSQANLGTADAEPRRRAAPRG